MFIGHFAVALAAKRAAPRTSLGTLFVAAQFVDMLWPIFLLLGWEQVVIAPKGNPFLTLDFVHYPWSHSLAMGIVWGVVLGGLYFVTTRYQRGAIVVGLLVPSHWVLDFIVHVPDLPIYPGGTSRLGLGVWTHPTITMLLEGAMFVAGVIAYARSTRPVDRAGRLAFGALVGFLALLYFMSVFGAPPPNVTVLAWAAMIGWPMTLWPWFTDRHRAATQP